MKCLQCSHVNSSQAKSCEACGRFLQLTPEEKAELAQQNINQISQNGSTNELSAWILIKKSKWLITVLLISFGYRYSYPYIQDYWEDDLQEKQERLDKQRQKQAALREMYPNGIPLPRMVGIPAGSFYMGSNLESDETHIHLVSIPAFKMAQTESTWEQYQACIDYGPCLPVGVEGYSKGNRKGNRPVTNVNWHDVKRYIGWINEQTGKSYRLLSESEWEYAARAGSTTNYSWGNSISCSQARYDNYNGDCGNDRKTVKVKTYSANKFGLYDMHGNVWEWTEDCWNKSYTGASTDGSAWTVAECDFRILRGGSWVSDPKHLRSSYRNRSDPSTRYNNYGFRLAQD